ncbi:response regulator transcription factor [Dehalogenimonas sp. THU2]|uniref:response regulator transcription factor n=1 Tax=Dehalogenimonas sp. THU2 TaxID=3151121 RepID=UPI00321880A6
MAKIVVVEDDSTLSELLKYNLGKEGFVVFTAADGNRGLEIIRREKPDVVITDVMMPGMDGFELTRLLRRESTAPILLLTARSEEIDRVLGLELGADDYLTKPFSMRELLARVKGMLRRGELARNQPLGGAGAGVLTSGNITLDPVRHVLTVGEKIVDLTPREFDLLFFLMTNRGQVFSRDSLLDRVWGYDYPGETRTVDVHIRWLRQKVEADPSNPAHLVTVRGVGYKFEE